MAEIGDPVIGDLYVRFYDTFRGWLEVHDWIDGIAESMGVDVGIGHHVPPRVRRMHENIDPLSEAIWGRTASYVHRLKRERAEAEDRAEDAALRAAEIASERGRSDIAVEILNDHHRPDQ